MLHWFVESIIHLGVTIFWGVFYAWTAVSLIAIIYAVIERGVGMEKFSGIAISYGSGLMRGIMVAAAGLAGVVVCWMILPVIFGVGPFPQPSRLFGEAGGGEKFAIAIAMLSTIVFNLGVWMALKSEEWSGEAKT